VEKYHPSVPRYAAFLRSLNVGAANRIKMDALRDVFTGAGAEDVSTYLQSGNVAFRHEEGDRSLLAHDIERAVEGAGLKNVAVALRTLDELDAIVALDPFGGLAGQDVYRFVLFLRKRCAADLSGLIYKDCSFVSQTPTEVFMTSPKGLPRPANPNALIERATASPSTGRFWNVVTDFATFCRR